MGVDVQRCTGLSMAQTVGDSPNVSSLGNHQCGVAVAEGMKGDFRETVSF